jgi:hypothetical protein
MARYLLVRGPASRAGEQRQGGMFLLRAAWRVRQRASAVTAAISTVSQPSTTAAVASGKSPLAGPADPAACHMPEDGGWDGGDQRHQLREIARY